MDYLLSEIKRIVRPEVCLLRNDGPPFCRAINYHFAGFHGLCQG